MVNSLAPSGGPSASSPPPWWRVGLYFTRLGLLGFGGPAAHVALMEDDLVGRKKWLTREEFVDLFGAVQLIPGPNSTEMALHVGLKLAGWRGYLAAGAGFVLPACLMSVGLAWVYVHYAALPAVAGVLAGLKPVLVVVIAKALWSLGGACVKDQETYLAALGGLAFHEHELAALLAAGLMVLLFRRVPRRPHHGPLTSAAVLPPLFAVIAPGSAVAVTPAGLFGVFFKAGALLFGSGYVLVAYLRADLVERLHWLTEEQLLDAIAVGQVTPGPVLSTAAFIGYMLAGWGGAAAATVGVFLPAFVLVALSGPLVPRLRKSKVAGDFLDGVNAASMGLLAAVLFRLAVPALVDLPTGWPNVMPCALAVVAVVLLFRFRVNPVWVVALGAAGGLAAAAL